MEFNENIKNLVEAVVGLFIIHPNPQLKGREKEVMKIAFEVLSKKLTEKMENEYGVELMTIQHLMI